MPGRTIMSSHGLRGAPRAIAAVLLSLVLGACASPIPDAIRLAPPKEVALAQARSQPEAVREAQVRWGGVIAKIDNRREATWLEVVARPLNNSGRPITGDTSLGRFLARVPGFLDPAIYGSGREITVRGRLDGVVQGTVGDYPYSYPLVQVQRHYLWRPLPEPDPRDYDPFWYYDPWYPWHPYPWRHPYWW